jgi:hypothetical protein
MPHCRKPWARSHASRAEEGVAPAGPQGGRGVGGKLPPQDPAPKRQLWALLETTDEQRPSGRVGLHRMYITAHRDASSTATHEQPRPRTPVEAPARSLLPGQRLVLVVSRVWPTEGPAFLVLAALNRQTQSNTQYHLSPHTYRALSPLSPPVPSFPPLPSFRLVQTRHILPPTHNNPVSVCTLLAAPCRPRAPLFLQTL